MQNGKISLIMDEPETEKILLEFPKYITTLYTLILNSTPRYTLGIYGDWGTGKTTLMKNVMSLLESQGCNCMEFNAWRFAHEERHATYPLMLSIMTKILENSNVQQSLQKGKLEKFKLKIWQVIKGLKGSVTLKIPELAEFNLQIDPSTMTPENEQKIDILKLADKTKPPLLEGIEIIRAMLDEVNGPKENSKLRLVIFIDDLDRCTPEKATEIFESVKVFFDIEGIVFVFGLSQTIIEAAINLKYEHFKGAFDGRSYLKKIIQVPFTLPTWSEEDIEKFVLGLIEKNENLHYANFFKENSLLIAQGIESNPREVKRLLNNFILSHQIHQKNNILDMKKLLAVQILSFTWRDFYDAISLDPEFLQNFGSFRKGSKLDAALRQTVKVMGSTQGINVEKPKDPKVEKFEANKKLMKFIKGEGKIIFEIDDKEWETYRRAASVEPDLKLLQELRSKAIKAEVEPKLVDNALDESRQIPSMRKINPSKVHKFQKTGGIPDQGQMQKVLSESLEINADSSGMVQFKFVSSKHQCSDLRIHLSIDDLDLGPTEWIGYPGRNPPLILDTDITTITKLSPGKHILTLQPEGRPGGCNQGYIQTWEGEIHLYQ
jgi:hypothetical protein